MLVSNIKHKHDELMIEGQVKDNVHFQNQKGKGKLFNHDDDGEEDEDEDDDDQEMHLEIKPIDQSIEEQNCETQKPIIRIDQNQKSTRFDVTLKDFNIISVIGQGKYG